MSKIRTSILTAISAMLILIGIGTWTFRLVEDWSWAESFYFSVATLTTVGYGDIHPTTDGSRVLAALFILFGVGIFFAAFTRISSIYLNTQENKLKDGIYRRVREHENKSKK